MDYDTYVAQLANLMVVGSTEANFLTFLPGCIDYANLRIQREMDLVATSVVASTNVFTVNSRNFTLPVPSNGSFIVVEEVNAIVPATSPASAGTRYPLQFVSKQFIDTVYPSNTANSSIPRYAFMLSPTEMTVGPPADQAYTAEVMGTIRLAPPSTSNTNPYLLTYFPDLFMAASMVYASGYMRDFGSQADNPQMSQSWEGQYTKLLGAAIEEEARKKSQAEGWTTESSPVATPKRV